MKTTYPDYFKDFRCIADKCEHSCCIGWEIDVDSDTLKQYKKVKGDFGKRLLENIDLKCDAPHFILGEKERCPFLNEKGLCDIIIELGEESLCDICSDHPRFRNFFSDREELGLGLCCEEACRLILSKEEPTEFITEDDGEDFELFEDEEILLSLRDELFDIARDRRISVDNRCDEILEFLETALPSKSPKRWAEFLSGLEIMDEGWKDHLDELGKADSFAPIPKEFQVSFEQLLVYFLYRHLAEAEDSSDLAARAAFAVLSVKIINTIFMQMGGDLAVLCDICRRYSSEIEYSEENTEKILNAIDFYI